MCNTIKEFLSDQFVLGALAAALGFILSHLFDLFILSPYRDWRELKNKIAVDVLFYSNILTNLGGLSENFKKKYIDSSDDLRKRMSEVSGYIITFPRGLRFFYADNKKLLELRSSLLLLSNLNNSRSDSIPLAIVEIDKIRCSLKIKL